MRSPVRVEIAIRFDSALPSGIAWAPHRRLAGVSAVRRAS